jgi:hypothetical protein
MRHLVTLKYLVTYLINFRINDPKKVRLNLREAGRSEG